MGCCGQKAKTARAQTGGASYVVMVDGKQYGEVQPTEIEARMIRRRLEREGKTATVQRVSA